MNGREYFHESVVKDIVDILTDLKDFDEVQFINNVNAKRSFKSITSATKDLILTFPVLVSTDIDPDNAIMIAKAQEKKMASLLHILFTAISVGNNEDVYDYVKKFHSNVGSLDGSLDSYSAALDKLATTFGESYDATLKIDHAVLESVLEDLRESEYVLPDNINESSLESYKVVPGYRTGYNDMVIQEGKNNKKGGKIYIDNSLPVNDPAFIDQISRTAAQWHIPLNIGQMQTGDINKNMQTVDTAFAKARSSPSNKYGASYGAAAQNQFNLAMHRMNNAATSVNTAPAVSVPNGVNGTPVQPGQYGFTTTTTSTSTSTSRTSDFESESLDRIRSIEDRLASGVNDDGTPLTDADKKVLEKQKANAEKSLKDYRNSRDKQADQAMNINRSLQRDTRPKAIQDKDMAEYMAKMADAHSKVVLNTEYKKANELQPTMMVVNFMKHTEEHGDYINTAVIGIKCKIYPISSSDIVNRISGKLRDKSFLTNFVRATTNEIGFFRDFLFAVDQAKFDAKSYGRQATSNKLWKVLERRGVKSKFRRSLKMYNDATAISTLVMSENDAEYLKKAESIDIMNVSRARKIMDEYNFLCLVVANQSTEVASFLYDTGDDTFEMIPFSGLEREASDNSYKKMVNLMAKISR